MQGSPFHGSPSPSPSPSLARSASATSRRVQNNAANLYIGESGSSSLRPSPRKLQSYYITPPGDSLNGGRVPPFFSPQLSPHRDHHSAVRNEAGDEASSPPPDEEHSYFQQPEAITTAAAYISPLLFSSKVAQKRFNAGPLYAESDHPLYEDESDRTPRGASRPSISPYKSPGISQIHLALNGYPYHAASAPSYGQESHSRRSLLQKLRILPLQVQRFFRTRRKKALSPELSTATKKKNRRTPSCGRRSVICLCFLLAICIYLIWPRQHSSTTSTPLPDNQAISNITEASSPSLPTRKWWQSSPQVDSISKKPRVGKKAKSYAALYHTLEELLALPSRYNLLSQDRTGPPSELPTLTVIIDCIDTQDPLGSEHKTVVDDLLASLAEEKVQPSSIRILISPDEYPRANPGLFGYEKGKTSIYTLSPSSPNFLATPAFGGVNSDYTLLLRCPTPGATLVNLEDLASLLQIAGTEQYSSKALTTSAILRRPSYHHDDPGLVAYGTMPRSNIDEHDEIPYRHLRESRPVNVPFGNLLINSAWLSALSVPSDAESRQEIRKSGGIIGKLAMRLDDQLKVKTWALPMAEPKAYASSAHQKTELLDYARQLQQDDFASETDTTHVEAARGSSAKVAVLLSDLDLQFATSWMNIICGFADDPIYGHEVQVFVSSDVEDSRSFVLECPEVEVNALSVQSLRIRKPDICLASSEAFTDHAAIRDTGTHFTIWVPGADLAHLEWLHALPLESLLNWNVPKIDLAVITNNRPVSLHRLLSSLHSAHYLGDKVNFLLNLEQTTDDQTQSILEGSQWPFGDVSIRHRVILGGLMTSIVESWYPINNDTYGVLLEDDVEVSPLFYSWLKFTILYYRYGTPAMRQQSERLYGISLYQPKNIELRPEGRRKFDAHKLLEDVGIPSTLPYLSQIPCSWGAVYFPEHWREFHQFLSIRLSEAAMDLADPIVPDIRSNRWPNSWKRYLIELVYLRGYSMLYPNYADFKSLSTNHLEQGTHVKDEVQAQKRRDLFEVPLLLDEDDLISELPDGRLPSWSSLPVIDFWGSIVNEQEIVERGKITSDDLELCPSHITAGQAENEVRASEGLDYDAAKLLCTGPMDEQDWKEWRMRVQRGANEIDVRMLMEQEARLEERERRVIELERQLEARASYGEVADKQILRELP